MFHFRKINFCSKFCISFMLSAQGITEEFVLYSGRFIAENDDWSWCPEDKPLNESCVEPFGLYNDFQLNWFNESRQGTCMGGYIDENGNYGWLQHNCDSLVDTPVKALCRLNCATYEEPESCDSTTTEIYVITSENIKYFLCNCLRFLLSTTR